MIRAESVEIEAGASVVWDIYTDVERWPEWTPSMKRAVPLDGSGLEVGKRFRLKQPWLPNLVWEVTEVHPGRSWTWQQRSPGGTTTAWHEIVPQGIDSTLVRQGIDQRGPVGSTIGVLMSKLTERYLAQEALGLKARCEQEQRDRRTR